MKFSLIDNRVMIIYDFHLIKITLAAAYRIDWKSINNGSKRNAYEMFALVPSKELHLRLYWWRW